MPKPHRTPALTPAPVREENPQVTVITGLEGPVWQPILPAAAHRDPEDADAPAPDGEEADA